MFSPFVKLRSLAEDQVAVALSSLQQEREQRLALKKEFEQVIWIDRIPFILGLDAQPRAFGKFEQPIYGH